MNLLAPPSELRFWKDRMADQMMGTAPNNRMMATPGVTKAQPVNCSDENTRRGTARDRLPGPARRWSRGGRMVAVTSAPGQHLVDLLGRGVQGGLRLRLAPQHRTHHVAEGRGELRGLGDLRPGPLDVGQGGC